MKLTTDWQKLDLAYAPTSPGTSWLDYNVVRASTPAGAVCSSRTTCPPRPAARVVP